jgi:ABC-type nitrate/sulfonate/bicarbonate transport system substrate-binding protein
LSLPPEERMRRSRALRLHLIVALFALLVLIAINALFSSRYPWWLWVLTAWVPLIAGHTAWAKGLFDRSKLDRNKEGS